ncbi:3-deoxy-D-manno-octulosonic acid transferase [Vibrio sp. ZSDZ34]|uniref:3-deoxy-D-manno-octulosonic acid transferase n=1 Tax=Vibrio gelatinilyticus TaxID=2893468 RepID=A0A9X2AXP3_9VIBR|nr:3-deoxy-D-manno-octulosonic acid transferase [Vibrio gelatinilyticus]MCJ2378610.1 3-deoxy-D-manno-octulosonic acid transferase [Vibrio gelatinilyticus]
MLSKAFLEKHFSALYFIGFTIGLAFAFIYANNQILTGDQNQMLEKGYLAVYSDIWTNFGNAASAVGSVPGSLTTWLVAGPLLIWDSPWAPMVLLFALRVVSLVLLDSVLKQIFDKPIRLLFLVLYWLNPWLLYDSILYNPSYLCFFASLHLWSAFKMREGGNTFIFTFLHVLSIGLAMQLHYSWPVLAVLSVFLLYRGMGKVSWFGVFSALFVLGLSLIPYIIEYMANEQLSRESDRYIGYGLVHVYPVLKALLYWIRYASLLFSNKVIAYSDFDWLTSIEWLKVSALYLWKGIVFIIGGLSVALSAKVTWDWWKSIKGSIKRQANSDVCSDKAQWLKLYAFGALIGVLVSAALSPITFSYWHLILVYPLALIPMLFAANTWLNTKPTLTLKAVGVLCCYLLLINILASHDSIKFSYDVNYAQQVEAFLEQSPEKYNLSER